MIRGIYTGLMGMLADQTKVDIAANNLANVDTSGFKKDEIAFKTYLEKEIVRNEHINTKQKRNSIGKLEHGVVVDEKQADMRQAALEYTGVNTNFAIESSSITSDNAFFVIQGQNGQRYYTRNGEWKINNEGYLVDNSGNFVLNNAFQPIQFTDQTSIDSLGNILEDGVLVGRIGLFRFENPKALNKIGNNYFVETNMSGLAVEDFDSEVLQGYVEKSNVNPIKEMLKLITAQRRFEISQRVITTEDTLLEAAINKVASTR